MKPADCLIITSIAGPENAVLQGFAEQCQKRGMDFIVAGDLKSPSHFHLSGCEFLSSAAQKQLPFGLAALLPDNSYTRKNLAYLQAIKKGAQLLVESDDDNLALPEFWQQRQAPVQGELLENTGWVNSYAYFSDTAVWPRGFALTELETAPPALSGNTGTFFCPIQQGLADENPDVDAIYRLHFELPLYFKKRDALVLGRNSICPFNSQNTTWFKAAFPLLYLPSYCSFRMTDIWRSFVAQRILWSCGWHLSFHSATVYQQRNAHDLMKDLEQEVSGYLYNGHIMEALCQLDLKTGEAHLTENLLRCYQLLVHKGYLEKEELVLVEAWINDVTHATAS